MDLGRGLRNALAKVTGAPVVDEKAVKELVKELQRVLISSDVDIKLVSELSKRIEKRALEREALKGLSPREHVIRVVYDELVSIMGERHEPKLEKQRMLLIGLYGSGKTTSVAKIAHFFKKKGLSVGVICCDVDRPAAYEQLEQLSKQVGAPFYGMKEEKDVGRIIEDAVGRAKEDVLILDSSGRSAFDEKLMGQLRQINGLFHPDEKLLVISADIGQVARRQAEQFNGAIGVDGVVITKFDGSGKGGGALTAVASSSARMAFVGTGEKMDDFEVYDAKKVVGRLLGFPDIETLLEKVKEISEEEIAPPVEEKLTIKTFYEQLKAAKKLGPLSKVFSLLGAPDMPRDMLQQSEEKLKSFEVIINSMTNEEREDASLLKRDRERMERIAKGSGSSVEDVRELIRQFERVKKMMEAFKKDRGFRKKMEKLLGGKKLDELT
jgi:signal recognition particle subunit SRP54